MGRALACVAETAFRSWLPLALFCVRGRSAGVCALGLSLRTPGFPSLVAEDGHRTQRPWLSEPPSWAHRGDGHSAFSGPALPQRGKEEQVLRVRRRRPANMGGWRRCQGSRDQGAGRSGEADRAPTVVESAHFIFSAENEQEDTPPWTLDGDGHRGPALARVQSSHLGNSAASGPWCLSCVRLRRS